MSIPYLHTGETKYLLQMMKDLTRHEGFREFAYPDPRSELYKLGKASEWGFRPAKDIMADIHKATGKNVDPKMGMPWTVGYGFTEGVSFETRMNRQSADRRLEDEIFTRTEQLKAALPWFTEATFVTRTVLANMAFNMGLKKLLQFKNTLAFTKAKNYKQAATNMRLSAWYKQVTSRAEELAKRMETQSIPAAYAAPEKL